MSDDYDLETDLAETARNRGRLRRKRQAKRPKPPVFDAPTPPRPEREQASRSLEKGDGGQREESVRAPSNPLTWPGAGMPALAPAETESPRVGSPYDRGIAESISAIGAVGRPRWGDDEIEPSEESDEPAPDPNTPSPSDFFST